MSLKKQPTEQQWGLMQSCLSGRFGTVKLRVDGFDVTFSREFVSGNTLGIMTYVNGSWKGAWTECDENGVPVYEEARRFMRVSAKAVYPAKSRESIIKTLGKREAAKHFNLDKRWFFCRPDWRSFNSLKRHLLKNNHDIEWVAPVVETEGANDE